MISVILIPVHQCARCLIANCCYFLNQLLRVCFESNFIVRMTRSLHSLHISLLGPTGPFFFDYYCFSSSWSNILDIYKIVGNFFDINTFLFQLHLLIDLTYCTQIAVDTVASVHLISSVSFLVEGFFSSWLLSLRSKAPSLQISFTFRHPKWQVPFFMG